MKVRCQGSITILLVCSSSIIALTAVLVTISTSVLTRLFSYLWGRCLPTKADNPENLSRLLVLEQRQNEFMRMGIRPFQGLFSDSWLRISLAYVITTFMKRCYIATFISSCNGQLRRPQRVYLCRATPLRGLQLNSDPRVLLWVWTRQWVEIADQQNAHSAAVAANAVVELYRLGTAGNTAPFLSFCGKVLQ